MLFSFEWTPKNDLLERRNGMKWDGSMGEKMNNHCALPPVWLFYWDTHDNFQFLCLQTQILQPKLLPFFADWHNKGLSEIQEHKWNWISNLKGDLWMLGTTERHHACQIKRRHNFYHFVICKESSHNCNCLQKSRENAKILQSKNAQKSLEDNF